MSGPERRATILFVAGASCATAIVLLLQRPQYLQHWDEIQLELARASFNLQWHQPHPPGYYLFVLLARVLGATGVSEPGRLISIFATAGMVSLVGLTLPRALPALPRTLLLLAAGLLVTLSPVVSFFAVANLTYAAEAFCWLLLLLWICASPSPRGWIAIAFAGGLAGGFRPTIPLWTIGIMLFAAWRDRANDSWRRAPLLLVAMVAGALCWLVPLVIESHGATAYVAAVSRLARSNVWAKSIFVEEGRAAFLGRLALMLQHVWGTLGPALLLPGAALCLRCARGTRQAVRGLDPLLAGSVLSFVFYALVIYDTDGYIVSFGITFAAYGLLALGTALSEWKRRRRAAVAALALALTGTLALAPMPGSAGASAGRRQQQRQDRELEQRFRAIREGLPPDSTLLVTSYEYWSFSFRHLMYYLPEYPVLQLKPDWFLLGTRPESPYWTAHRREVWTAGPENLDLGELRCFSGPEQLRYVLFVHAEDATECIDGACRPLARPFRLTEREIVPLLRLDGKHRMHVRREKLVCVNAAESADGPRRTD
jgi:hypothetical protein